MDTVIKRDNATLTINWKDSSGAAATPTSAQYRIDDRDSKQQIRGWTNLAATASVQIELTYNDNVILDPSNAIEGRRLTAVAVYGTDTSGYPKQKTVEFDYEVRNANFAT